MKYRKKPVEIEAVIWTGLNGTEIQMFCGVNSEIRFTTKPGETEEKFWLIIHTLEGDHFASVGDYIIKGVQGEFYPCKPDIFEQTYEPVSE